MKNVFDKEPGLTLKVLRLQWFGSAGQCLALHQDTEAEQLYKNIIDTIPRDSIAYRQATELATRLHDSYTSGLNTIKKAVAGRALETQDSQMDVANLGHELLQNLQCDLWDICLKHNLLDMQ